jgi:hypothetical protein
MEPTPCKLLSSLENNKRLQNIFAVHAVKSAQCYKPFLAKRNKLECLSQKFPQF